MNFFLVFTATAIVCVINQPVVAQNSKSVQQLIAEAEKLASEPGQAAVAIEKYQAAIELHSENDKKFNHAVRNLLRELEKEQRQEEGIHLLYDLYQGEAVKARYQLITQTLKKYENKYPELFKKFQEEFIAANRKKKPEPRIAPQSTLLDSILQRENPKLRAESLGKLKELLSPNSSEESKISGLSTLIKALPAKFNHESFYEYVSPLIDSENESIRYLALACLPGVGGTAKDLPRLAKLVDDESENVRKQVGGTLVSIGNGKQSEIVIPALMQLMEDTEQDVVKRTIRSMWGQYSSPEFDRFLVDLSYDENHGYNVVYHCLSTMPSKSEVVCERLIEVLAKPDWNSSGRAAWGLTYGVTQEAKLLVEEGLLSALPEETNTYTRKQEFRALQNVASEKSRNYLESVAASDLETDEFKNLAKLILDQLVNSAKK